MCGTSLQDELNRSRTPSNPTSFYAAASGGGVPSSAAGGVTFKSDVFPNTAPAQFWFNEDAFGQPCVTPTCTPNPKAKVVEFSGTGTNALKSFKILGEP